MVYVASDTRYETMKYNRVGRSGLKLPAISLGLWHNFGGINNAENGRNMITRSFDLGITHLILPTIMAHRQVRQSSYLDRYWPRI